MTASVEIPYYTPPEPPDDEDQKCVVEIDRLGYLDNCGLPVDEGRICAGHMLDIDAGRIPYAEYQRYVRHYGA
ncbi:hypothetical protein [Nocardiopsis sp. NRRL B-16309]|uniref:hypothetical protein n=1 Tax=Nocardiopsis sp. NRRL B-16309 TaxID=1519494 RepID=UPI0006B04977|nr:hypothetical protein [Nocardiopsis sp. NRRL B-16309]KOX10132.1 hypothetical protein ADL05_25975 [Nocardiopsis sp. NRRL B-16309]